MRKAGGPDCAGSVGAHTAQGCKTGGAARHGMGSLHTCNGAQPAHVQWRTACTRAMARPGMAWAACTRAMHKPAKTKKHRAFSAPVKRQLRGAAHGLHLAQRTLPAMGASSAHSRRVDGTERQCACARHRRRRVQRAGVHSEQGAGQTCACAPHSHLHMCWKRPVTAPAASPPRCLACSGTNPQGVGTPARHTHMCTCTQTNASGEGRRWA